jgi:hypothetical protein
MPLVVWKLDRLGLNLADFGPAHRQIRGHYTKRQNSYASVPETSDWRNDRALMEESKNYESSGDDKEPFYSTKGRGR